MWELLVGRKNDGESSSVVTKRSAFRRRDAEGRPAPVAPSVPIIVLMGAVRVQHCLICNAEKPPPSKGLEPRANSCINPRGKETH